MPTKQPRRCAAARPPSDRLRQPAIYSRGLTTRHGRGLTARGQLFGVGRAHFSAGVLHASPGVSTATQPQAFSNAPKSGVARNWTLLRCAQPRTTAAAGVVLAAIRLCDVVRGEVAAASAQARTATSGRSSARCYTNPGRRRPRGAIAAIERAVRGLRHPRASVPFTYCGSRPATPRLSCPVLCCALLTGSMVGSRTGNSSAARRPMVRGEIPRPRLLLTLFAHETGRRAALPTRGGLRSRRHPTGPRSPEQTPSGPAARLESVASRFGAQATHFLPPGVRQQAGEGRLADAATRLLGCSLAGLSFFEGKA